MVLNDKKLREGFEKHASPEAIKARMKAVRAKRAPLNSELSWLTVLLDERLEQVERGEWPPPKFSCACGGTDGHAPGCPLTA